MYEGRGRLNRDTPAIHWLQERVVKEEPAGSLLREDEWIGDQDESTLYLFAKAEECEINLRCIIIYIFTNKIPFFATIVQTIVRE